jgi:hypothetical protein
MVNLNNDHGVYLVRVVGKKTTIFVFLPDNASMKTVLTTINETFMRDTEKISFYGDYLDVVMANPRNEHSDIYIYNKMEVKAILTHVRKQLTVDGTLSVGKRELGNWYNIHPGLRRKMELYEFPSQSIYDEMDYETREMALVVNPVVNELIRGKLDTPNCPEDAEETLVGDQGLFAPLITTDTETGNVFRFWSFADVLPWKNIEITRFVVDGVRSFPEESYALYRICHDGTWIQAGNLSLFNPFGVELTLSPHIDY